MKSIKIITAAHKPCIIPKDDIHLPLQVGAALSSCDLGFCRDDTGDNISEKNPYYCELTGLYWAWKNLKADYIGLSHYRRYFAGRHFSGSKYERIADKYTIKKALSKNDVILPLKRHYYIETTYSQYVHAHHKQDIVETRRIIAKEYPEYTAYFDKVMKKRSGHRFNMLIMKKELFDDYCEWLFSILFRLEKDLDISEYSANDKRVFGFIGERLLDVWIEKNNISYSELPYVYTEKQNWLKKGTNFLKRKFIGKTEKNVSHTE